jgi:hypothetical protein
MTDHFEKPGDDGEEHIRTSRGPHTQVNGKVQRPERPTLPDMPQLMLEKVST